MIARGKLINIILCLCFNVRTSTKILTIATIPEIIPTKRLKIVTVCKKSNVVSLASLFIFSLNETINDIQFLGVFQERFSYKSDSSSNTNDLKYIHLPPPFKRK